MDEEIELTPDERKIYVMARSDIFACQGHLSPTEEKVLKLLVREYWTQGFKKVYGEYVQWQCKLLNRLLFIENPFRWNLTEEERAYYLEKLLSRKQEPSE